MPKVSVIIPVYNAKDYIDKCLGSLLNQTLNDIEIIVIDDGSTDNSLELLNSYATKDSRIKVISQENAKQGAARNRGLEIASGEFITFVDIDDWVNECYLEKLYNGAVENNVNIAAAYATRDYKHKIKKHFNIQKQEIFYEANEIVQGIDKHLEAAGKLYRFEPIKDLRFEENVLYEDAPYSLKAICLEGSMVTIPEAHYHYVSNPTSTIKQKLNIKNENDKIATSLQLLAVAEENNIDIDEWAIIKKEKLFTKVKYYKDYQEHYFLGIKIATRKQVFDNTKVFLVFNTACFGDVLLCNSLCQNIKAVFPESKVVFITDKRWSEVAKYQQGVDEVFVYDKKGVHKGFGGMLKFLKEFPYKKPFASFITYKNERNLTIAKLLKSRFVLTPLKNHNDPSMQYRHAKLLESLTHKKIVNLPIKYNLPSNVENPVNGEKYIAMCCITKNPPKDMPLNTAVDLINKINAETEYKVVLTGAGDLSEKYANDLAHAGADFINLVNKTSILELGAVLKDSVGLISCDTGTMHFGYALGVLTAAVFYEDLCVPIWSPNPQVYKNVVLIDKEQTAEHIFVELMELINKEG